MQDSGGCGLFGSLLHSFSWFVDGRGKVTVSSKLSHINTGMNGEVFLEKLVLQVLGVLRHPPRGGRGWELHSLSRGSARVLH